MDKNTQTKMAKNWQKAFVGDPLTVWKDMALQWTAGSMPFCDLSAGLNNPLQVIRPYMAFKLKQQKTFVDLSGVWMNYLLTVAKSQRESQTNGGTPLQAINGVFDASQDMMKSSLSLWEGHLESIYDLYKSSCASKAQPART